MSDAVEGLLVRRSYYARVKARNQSVTSAASNEVRIESVDLRDVIDALYFGSGRLIPRLPRGASRSAFQAAGLVNAASGLAPGATSSFRRFRIGPGTERVIVDHRSR
jgi:hypothetical protein